MYYLKTATFYLNGKEATDKEILQAHMEKYPELYREGEDEEE